MASASPRFVWGRTKKGWTSPYWYVSEMRRQKLWEGKTPCANEYLLSGLGGQVSQGFHGDPEDPKKHNKHKTLVKRQMSVAVTRDAGGQTCQRWDTALAGPSSQQPPVPHLYRRWHLLIPTRYMPTRRFSDTKHPMVRNRSYLGSWEGKLCKESQQKGTGVGRGQRKGMGVVTSCFFSVKMEENRSSY